VKHAVLVACLGAIGCNNSAPPYVGVPPITSNFDSDAEGWKLQGFNTDAHDYPTADPKTQLPATYDNVEHAIKRDETFYGYGDYFAAPSAYLGNRAAYVGATLYFDLKVTTTEQPFSAALVVLQCNGKVRLYSGPADPGVMWTDYSVPFSGDGSWVDATTGAAVSANDFLACLTGISGLFIRGEFSSAIDSSWLDNVELSF
jgi:hypothetical protein